MSNSNYIGKKKAITKRKMKPYVGDNKEAGKYYYDDDEDRGNIPSSSKRKALKEEIKNANRSLKKSKRQEGKNQIRNFLTNNLDVVII